ncbi:uncharacterized protein LOC131893312 [Tigriopus californicus]|uniref:uncharacterized protein LOC131893312 n=1 Tax=Tigriopus californicus TaxID=6832 RepID=UPI0027DA4EF9|nr:uncharacterized protein LOC131893312 [Tigriopus californicus]
MFATRSLIIFLFGTLLDFQPFTLGDRVNRTSEPIGFHRQKKLFSLFNIVQFKNDPCSGVTPGDNRGTCLSVQECSSQGGTSDGNCASGFGVCCLFMITGCGGTVNKNCTYVRNTGFPGSDPNNGRTCSVTLNRFANDICQIRLDFQSTTTLPLGTDPGSCGGTGDSLSVISPHSSSQNAFPPAICGILTGQHMYFESGRMGGNAGQIDILQGSAAGERRYNVKVTYIHCNSKVRAPSGCTQYFTGCTGTITSYNFPGGQLLGDQVYGNCIRQNEGYCSVQYSETPITSPDPFDLDTADPAGVQDNCMVQNHITIPSRVIEVLMSATPGDQQDVVTSVPSMRCNTVFGSAPRTSVPGTLVSEENVPFVVNLRTLPSTSGRLATFSGFSLDYTQVPC